jgi:hypothetical protein
LHKGVKTVVWVSQSAVKAIAVVLPIDITGSAKGHLFHVVAEKQKWLINVLGNNTKFYSKLVMSKLLSLV